MTTLERRDRRRALKIVLAVWEKFGAYYVVSREDAVRIVAEALRREREEAGFAAVNYLFATKAKRRAATVVLLRKKEVQR